MKILLIDDHRLFAYGLKLALEQIKENVTVEEAYTAQRALGLVDAGNHYDLILTDLQMPGFGGHEFVQSITSRKIPVPVAVISSSEAVSDISKARNMGAKGYIFKSDPAFDLIPKIEALLSGKEVFPDVFWRSLQDIPVSTSTDSGNKANTSGLGKRPIQVLQLLAQGKSNKQIATVLCISETTVKFHIRALFTALDVNNRTWCVREAERRGLIEDNTL